MVCQPKRRSDSSGASQQLRPTRLLSNKLKKRYNHRLLKLKRAKLTRLMLKKWIKAAFPTSTQVNSTQTTTSHQLRNLRMTIRMKATKSSTLKISLKKLLKSKAKQKVRTHSSLPMMTEAMTIKMRRSLKLLKMTTRMMHIKMSKSKKSPR